MVVYGQTMFEEGQEDLCGSYVKLKNLAAQRWCSLSPFLDRIAENLTVMDNAYYEAKRQLLPSSSVKQELLEVSAIMRSMVGLTKACQLGGVPTAAMAMHVLIGKRTNLLNREAPLSVIDPEAVKRAVLEGK